MIGSAFKGAGKTFAGGFNAVADLGKGNLKGALGGIGSMSLGGTIGLAGAGAAVGGGLSALYHKDNKAEAAATGAVIGGAAIPAAGMALGGAYAVGRGAFKSAPSIARGIGGVGASAGNMLFSGITKPVFSGAGAMSTVANNALNPVGRYANAASKLTSKMTKMDYGPSFGKGRTRVKMSGLGKTVIGAGALIGAVKGITNTADSIRMGRAEGGVQTATPRPPSYANNAGATGDLNFALHANRRG